MIHASEGEERRYLARVVEMLRGSLEELEREVLDYADGVVALKREAWESMGTLDKVERAAYRIAVSEETFFAQQAVARRDHLRKLVASPYFGRVDFGPKGEEPVPYYIGIHAYVQGDREVIVDWRAPLSGIFYDFETGPASYRAPRGEVSGSIAAKRQYRIRESRMEYMLESALNIGDDILQRELSRASDQRMRNIVATIQKEQNRIIRNESARVLIIQGAAGSGKTSIALHRVAFLLYRHKRTLRAEDVLVLSPNRVFGSYIAGVLPELGEETIPQMGFEDLARQILGRTRKFQSFAQQVARLIHRPDEAALARIRYKASPAFVEELAGFLTRSDRTGFRPESFRVEGLEVTAEELGAEYRRLERMPVRKRLEKLAADRIAAYGREHAQPLSTAAKREVKARILQMFPHKNALSLYRSFYSEPGRRGLLRAADGGGLEFCDVFPLAWLTVKFQGLTHRYGAVKHLLVDEMQDYTPIQYALLAELFSCPMTILGDRLQSVNPYSSSSVESIAPFFPGAERVELRRSYRSTVEILRFAQTIRHNPGLAPMERHGEPPSLTGCGDRAGELRHIAGLIRAFRRSGHHSLGVVCKSQELADELYEELKGECAPLVKLDPGSEEFAAGVMVTSCHMAKGLEFDWVVAPGCSAEGYHSELDRSLLYIACTRAMHRLALCWHGERSPLLAQEELGDGGCSA